MGSSEIANTNRFVYSRWEQSEIPEVLLSTDRSVLV